MRSHHLIDCTLPPFLPTRWTVEKHVVHEPLLWSRRNVRLHLDDAQKHGWLCGHIIREKLAAIPVANANVLDFLIGNQNVIPRAWSKSPRNEPLCIYFWGTIYWSAHGLCVRYLTWSAEQKGWIWDRHYLDYKEWGPSSPALVLKR